MRLLAVTPQFRLWIFHGNFCRHPALCMTAYAKPGIKYECGDFVRKLICLMIFQLLASVMIQPALAQSEERGIWLNRAPMPSSRQEYPLAVVNGKIYVPGGLTSDRRVSELVEVYDPATDSWSEIAPLPQRLHHTGMAAVRGTLYVIGGYTDFAFSESDRVYAYDATEDEWRERSPLPRPRGGHIAVEFDGRIYVFGGTSSRVATADALVYDPGTDTWEALPPMPTAREHLAAARLDSLIYVVGGRARLAGQGLVNTDVLEAYSPAGDRWYELPPMPTARGGLAAAALQERLFVFGGEIPAVFDQNEAYDPSSGTWQQMTAMPSPRHGMGAATLGDTIFVIGGGSIAGLAPVRTNEAFVLTRLTALGEDAVHDAALAIEEIEPFPVLDHVRLQFRLARPGQVALHIINAHGRIVLTALEGTLNAGLQQMNLDCRALANGSYFYSLSLNGKRAAAGSLLVLR